MGSHGPGSRATASHAVDLTTRYRQIRAATERLAAPLSPEDCQVQSMEDASPTKWHLAHTSWFFETFVLEVYARAYRAFDPQYRVLFNSYYQTVGTQHPRPQRGLLSRPSLEEVLAYRSHVDRHLTALLQTRGGPSWAETVELGLQHEQQHQELILTDVKHLLASQPLRPAYRACASPAQMEPLPLSWHEYVEGIYWIGDAAQGFAFDNERPRHRVFTDAFALASRPVINAEFLAFMNDGGYRRPELWLSDGWITAQHNGWIAPLYWERHEGGWFTSTLSGVQRLRPDEPVCHIGFYEADAFARWAGARLPTEVEWEIAASTVPVDGNLVETGWLHPAPAQAAPSGLAQLFGDVWEWTQSAYGAYPGYCPPPGALGEYNGKFMCNQMVLRGGSCVTPRSHIRASYRNFFPPAARWQFSGVRLARDAGRVMNAQAR
jgi:ergothioneine biosynthesis protein EgtB